MILKSLLHKLNDSSDPSFNSDIAKFNSNDVQCTFLLSLSLSLSFFFFVIVFFYGFVVVSVFGHS